MRPWAGGRGQGAGDPAGGVCTEVLSRLEKPLQASDGGGALRERYGGRQIHNVVAACGVRGLVLQY